MNCNIDVIARKFYAASNNVFSNTRGSPELMQLHLQEAYCLPILQYASAAVCFTQTQLNTMNACWNNVYRKIFGFNLWNSVKQFICGLGNLDFISLRNLAMLQMYKSMFKSDNSVVRLLMQLYSVSDEFRLTCVKLEINRPISMLRNNSRHDIKQYIYDMFSVHLV